MATSKATANLQAAYESLCAKLAEIEADPQPTYSEKGRSISWETYHNSLLSRIERLAKIPGVAPEQAPVFTIRSVVR